MKLGPYLTDLESFCPLPQQIAGGVAGS